MPKEVKLGKYHDPHLGEFFYDGKVLHFLDGKTMQLKEGHYMLIYAKKISKEGTRKKSSKLGKWLETSHKNA